MISVRLVGKYIEQHDKAFSFQTEQQCDMFPIGNLLGLPDSTIEISLHFLALLLVRVICWTKLSHSAAIP